ncbi:hypothetical protein A1O1_06971 [Capronia coronata CBS 617.96]|uniref:F-box domain-containing protein n=1 Tax=Capronia coronata CBS 617.96 TaxID=1182541 RepID=W9Y171_9EURO|nr:uncharacterized protein A1O1_06971 [Capronia coronata CBS 617.96]EXJ83350.1 hypothetical protein A1O1_06971 [Capronia coronata CBS 617.96]
MTLRHPERLGPDGEYDSDPSTPRFILEHGAQDNIGDNSSTAPGRAASKQACEKPQAVHPFTTDFGPKTLTEYLRTECEKLEKCSPPGKGKEKEDNRTTSDQSHHADLTSGVYPISIPGMMPAVRGGVGSSVNGQLLAASLAGAVSAGPNTNGYLNNNTVTRQSLRDERGTHPTARLSETTNVQRNPHSNGSNSLASTASRTGTRRSRRLARQELNPPDGGHGKTSPGEAPLPPLQSATAQPSRVQAQAATLLPDTDVKDGASGAQNANHGEQPANSASDSAIPSMSRRTNFEEHTKTKRQVVRSMTTRAPQTVDDIVAQPRKKMRQNKSSQQSGVPSALNIENPVALGFVAERSSRQSHLPTTAQAAPGGVSDMATAGNQMPVAETPDKIHSIVSERPVESRTEEDSPPGFDFSAVVPERIPEEEKQKFLRAAQRGSHSETNTDSESEIDPSAADARRRRPTKGKKPSKTVCISHSSYPRGWSASKPSCLQRHNYGNNKTTNPMTTSASASQTAITNTLEDFNTDLWVVVARHLSTEDLKRLRLVSQTLAQTLDPILFRNVVVNFGKGFFDVTGSDYAHGISPSPSTSMFEKYGSNINQFGVAFEYDLNGLSQAKTKVIEKEQTAWFGTFTWPTEQYPRFPALQAVEDLVDHNRPLLKETLKHITKASELGLCIDSGHGWLEGPDISDLALFNSRMGNGSKVFGKTFTSEDVWTTFARDEYFQWAQQNTINETMKHMLEHRSPGQASAVKEVRFLDSIEIRDVESFKSQEEQLDLEPEAHVGGASGTNAQDFPIFPPALVGGWMPGNAATTHRSRRSGFRRQSPPKRQPQWPLIFNGHNLAAENGGHCSFVQAKTAHPASAPLLPGHLTEAQAQWLMETVWAQRAFLSAYTTAIITNKQNFKSIHTVRISKLSSRLLPSLEQSEFWSSLPGLKHLQVLISPDWRQEHCIGDRFHFDNMPISPAKAAEMFTRFLRTYVAKMENLHSLAVGYVGGGEHAVGMFARNQHVLPAPIVDDPGAWLHDDSDRRDVLLTKFDHIRDLKFENCWFSPSMLQEFMDKSRDTSLHSLVLDSVSMIASHDPTIVHALTTPGDSLRCHYDPWNWHRETLPVSAAWCQVLDSITPGPTLAERKLQTGFHRRDSSPGPARKSFRGHVQKIVLNSCGYVKISLPKHLPRAYKQNAAVVHLYSPLDGGLRARKERFNVQLGPPSPDDNRPAPAPVVPGLRLRNHRGANNDGDAPNQIMMSTLSPTFEEYPWLGTLTQCIHPIEKRVLEEAWDMTFGWPDNLERWASVEDGFYEGGTGRFSGVLEKDSFKAGWRS